MKINVKRPLQKLPSQNNNKNKTAEKKKHQNVTKKQKDEKLNSRHGLAAYILNIGKGRGIQMCHVSQNRFRAHGDGTEHK